jgi:hypothetical protein
MACSERDENERDIPLMDLLDRWESHHKNQESRIKKFAARNIETSLENLAILIMELLRGVGSGPDRTRRQQRGQGDSELIRFTDPTQLIGHLSTGSFFALMSLLRIP